MQEVEHRKNVSLGIANAQLLAVPVVEPREDAPGTPRFHGTVPEPRHGHVVGRVECRSLGAGLGLGEVDGLG